MLVENTREEALKAFLNGRKVRVYCEYDDGSMDVQKLEDMLPEEDFHYLIDVPAYANPELEQVMPLVVSTRHQGQGEQVPPPSEKPEESLVVLPAGKTNKEIALELAEEGLSVTEIAKQTGMKYNTVYYYLNPDKCGKKANVLKVAPGHNADRHLCKTCRYRNAAKSPKNGCDYAAIVGHSRGCEVEICDKHEKGNPVSKRRQSGFYEK